MSDKEKNNLSEEEYLKQHLSNFENKSDKREEDFDDSIEYEDSSTISDLKYFNFSVDQLPCGRFYPKGTLLMVRPAQVKEIQAFSMIDDNNTYDIIEKMNYMIQSCIRIKFQDGSIGTYLDLKDQDRIFTLFLIRELTFQKGNDLTVKTTCPLDEQEVIIPLKIKNFIFQDVDEKLEKYYNSANGTYRFRLKNGKTYELTPPNIGIQKSFTDYIIKENNEKKNPNMAFLKIIPFMLPGRKSITYEGIKKKLKEFETMDEMSFQFLNSAVDKMKIGIKELKIIHECGEEIRADMTFPNGFSDLFIIRDAFDAYIEE